MTVSADGIQSLYPTIRELLKASGSPGLSVGVLHHDEVVHTAHFGLRNVDQVDAPDDNTIYHVASLTKIITATAVALLVHDGILDWNLPIWHYLAEFAQRKDEIGQQCTLIDLLSNRTGIALANALYGQKLGEFLLPKNEIVHTACRLEAIKPFRSAFVYSQWNYALVTEIIERMTGQTFGTYVLNKILRPLGMDRTSFRPEEGWNTACPYVIDDDGTPHRITSLNLTDESGFAGANAARSTIKDLLAFFQALLSAFNDQSKRNVDSTDSSPLKNVRKIFNPQITVGKRASDGISYCLGLYRNLLPNNLGISSVNNLLFGAKRMPRIGAKFPGTAIYHHTGNLPGYFVSAFLIPSTSSAVIVLTNSLPFADPTDFVGQLIISHLLNEPPCDMLTLCKLGRSASLAWYQGLAAQLERDKTTRPPPLPLSAYKGDYFNAAGNFCLSIAAYQEEKGLDLGLIMTVQNKPLTKYQLKPYDGNTFYWPANRDAELKQGMWPIISVGWHKVTFVADNEGVVTQLLWGHDPSVKDAERFQRKGVLDKSKLAKF